MSFGHLKALVAAVLGAAVFATPAAAESVLANNSQEILLADVTNQEAANRVTPSTISVAGLEGPIVDVDLTLSGIKMARLGLLQVLLVSPSGDGEIAMSFNCSDLNVNRDITFDQSASAAMPYYGDGACPLSTYQPSGYHANPFPFGDLPGGPHTSHDFGHFNNENANGTWRLYAFKHCGASPCNNTDEIEGGWSLRVVTADTTKVDIPAGSGTAGPASPFPAALSVTNHTGLITDLNVRIDGVFHAYPDDVDMMLHGPEGQRVMLMSDACGSYGINAYGWVWDDEAPGPMADEGTTDVCRGTFFRPTDRQPGESLPAPAPAGPYATSLTAFDLTDPNGVWRLWVADDSLGGEGFFTNQFVLQITTRPRAAVSFAQSAVEVAEGQNGSLTLTRSGAAAYAPGSVTVTSTPGSAESGTDYTPVATTVEFAAGQTEKTVPVDALADAPAESGESYTVTIGSPAGDAAIGSPSSATVTIPANAESSPGGGGGDSGGGGGDTGGGGEAGDGSTGGSDTGAGSTGGSDGASDQDTVIAPIVAPRGTTGEGSKPSFGATTLVKFKLARKRIPRSGPVPILIINANPFMVRGRISAGKKVRSFAVAADGRQKVRLRLSKRAQRRLARRGRLPLRLTARLVDPAGTARIVRKTVTPRLRNGR